MPITPNTKWRKAKASNGNGQCVELAPTGDGVALRDSKDPDGPVLLFTRAELAAFLNGAKAGEFDDLAAGPEGRCGA